MSAFPSSSIRRSGWMNAVGRAIAKDKVLYLLILMYTSLAAAFDLHFGRFALLCNSFEYIVIWLDLAVLSFLCIWICRFIERSCRERPSSPFVLAKDLLRDLGTPNIAAGATLYSALAIFMGSFTTMKTLLPRLNDFWADPWLARIDSFIHFGQQPWRLLAPLLGHPPVTRTIEFVYGPVWMICVTLVPLYFCMTSRRPDHRRRFLLAFLLTWIVNGTIVAGLCMSGGPAFYGKLTHDDDLFGDLVRYLATEVDSPGSAAWQQRELWSIYRSASSGVGAGISAFPSLHVSMIILCCLGIWGLDKRAAAPLIAVAIVIVLGSIHLGWHYAIGDYSVVVLMIAIWRTSGLFADPSKWRSLQVRCANTSWPELAFRVRRKVRGSEVPEPLAASGGEDHRLVDAF